MLPGYDQQMRVRGLYVPWSCPMCPELCLMCPELVEGQPADFDKRRPELVEGLSPHSTHKRLTTRLVS